MSSLRQSIATLKRYNQQEKLNISDVYHFLFMKRPVSLKGMIAEIKALPEAVPFHSIIKTGTALGGEVTMTLHRDGSYNFSGFMRATGALSFSFRIGVVVRSASGKVILSAQHTGKVFGTDSVGNRKNKWDETINQSKNTGAIRNLWPDISKGSISVTRSSELSGVLGTSTQVIKDIAEFFIVAQTLGAPLAVCLIIGSELGDAGVAVPGMGGITGIGIIAGAVYIWGPLAIGPAFIIGVAAGAVIDALIKIRPLRVEEQEFAKQVFGDQLEFSHIRITNLVGLGGRPFTIPTIDNHVLVNIGVNDDMFQNPITTSWGSYTVAGQLLIHELTHAWQIQHASIENVYVPGFLCEGIREQETMGKAAYKYGPSGPPWNSFTLEGQAHMVDDWFAGTGRQAITSAFGPKLVPMNPESDYIGYIDNNIQTGNT